MPQPNRIAESLLAQRGHLFAWVPVGLAIGIGGYFALSFEPSGLHYLAAGAVAVLASVAALRAGPVLGPLFWAVVLVVAGLLLAGGRAHLVKDAVIGWRYYGPVEGRIVAIDRASSDALRLTLDNVVLRDVSPERTPGRVRVSLHGKDAGAQPEAGMTVIVTAHLSPPGGPVEPGGFDFRRHAWFQGVGAVGYSRTPLLMLEPPDNALPVFRWRMALSARVQQALPGEVGAFAAAIMTGERSGMARAVLTDLRVSNLAHLLAISGLHMGLLAGFVFASLRVGFALVPRLGLRVPAKKLAAALALVAAAGYLVLSGGNVATERAFVMVAVALVAVIADRRALTLRAVAVAAVIVLVRRPEDLLSPGFQMSFAATTALIAVFSALRDRRWTLGPKWLRPVAAVALSSAVAGLATAPVGAAHFNQIAHYGMAANLLTVPLMGVLVMPAAVVAALLLPFGLEGLGLWVMGKGLAWILGVADFTASMEGARGTVVSPAGPVLPLIALGALWLILWQGRARLAGLALVAAGFLLWQQTERPAVLVADTGALIGVMTPEGRALSRPRGAGFIALNWLENDGDAADQATAAARWRGPVDLGGTRILQVNGKRAEASIGSCRPGDLLILSVKASRAYDCTVYDPERLRQSGALALYAAPEGGVRINSASDRNGVRLWSAQ